MASHAFQPARAGSAIDELMERASHALYKTDYFDAQSLCLKAMKAAHRARDFDRMGRICMPLQEARRQLRHLATDTQRVTLVTAPLSASETYEAGCYLVAPPMVGVESRAVRELLARKKVPSLVLCREPTMSTGQWPLVAVAESDASPFPLVVRVRLAPPAGETPDIAWLLAAQEALGDAAIAKVNPRWPADHRVEDLLEWLDAVPDHEKLSQALQATCFEAAGAPASIKARRRGMKDPFSF